MPPQVPIDKNITLALSRLKQLFPQQIEEAPCPPSIGGKAIPYADGSYLIYLPDGLLFLIGSGQGRQNSRVQTVLQGISFATAALLPSSSGSGLTLLGKNSSETLNFEELTTQRISNAMYGRVTPTKIPDTEQASSSEVNQLTVEHLQRMQANEAPLLERYVSLLTKSLVNSQGAEAKRNYETWQEVARASLRLLPETIHEPKLAKSTITAIARSIVFLSPQDRIRAVKNILDVVLDGGIHQDLREQLSNIVLAVAPSLNPDDLIQIVRASKLRLGQNEKIPPSLAQLISFVQARFPKL